MAVIRRGGKRTRAGFANQGTRWIIHQTEPILVREAQHVGDRSREGSEMKDQEPEKFGGGGQKTRKRIRQESGTEREHRLVILRGRGTCEEKANAGGKEEKALKKGKKKK